MTVSDLEHFKNLLLEREQNLSGWLESAEGTGSGEVAKVSGLLSEIKAALGRVEDHTFGTCMSCKDGVEFFRLEVQPVTEICIGCLSKQEQAQLEEDLFMASKIHRALLPQSIEKIDGFDVALRSSAARNIGGDYYDFLPSSNNGHTRVVIADSMGSGLAAGLLMSNVQGVLRILSEDIESPKLLISRLNRWLCRNVPVTKFVSLACLAIPIRKENEGNLVYTNAGHCPPIVVRNNGNVERLAPTGGILGVHPDFEYTEMPLSIGSGDMILLYTDGVTEAENSHEEMFGEERLMKTVTENRRLPLNSLVDCILDDVRTFSERPELADDVTVIALRKG